MAIVGTDDEWDLRLDLPHGAPYDPWLTLVSRCLPPIGQASAETPRDIAVSPALRELVERAVAEPDEARREALYPGIQACLDEDVPLVPLYSPRRLAILRAGLPRPVLTPDLYRLDASWLTDR